MQTKLRITLLIFAAGVSTASVSAAPRVMTTTSHPHFVGTASWYGRQHQGRKKANGQKFDRYKLTAAYWYLPLGSTIRVTNLENGKSITVTVTDRGPNLRLNRILDLSEAAARELDYILKGLTSVFVYPISSYEPQHAEFSSALVGPTNEVIQSASTLQEDMP